MWLFRLQARNITLRTILQNFLARLKIEVEPIEGQTAGLQTINNTQTLQVVLKATAVGVERLRFGIDLYSGQHA